MTRPGLDGLAQPHIVGDQQVGPGHRQRPDHRVELVVLDLDSGPERRLEHRLVRRGDRTPPNGVEERVQLARVIETVGGVGQCVLVVRDRPALKLPDHPQPLVAGVVFDADQGDQMGGRPMSVWPLPATMVPGTTSEATHIRFRTVTSWPGAGAAPLSVTGFCCRQCSRSVYSLVTFSYHPILPP